jgi:hypothetical protein
VAAEYLFIVARNRLELYGYFRRTFAGDARLEVLLDRRAQERRRRSEPRDGERRQRDRRGAPNVAAHLPEFGFAIIRLRY